jgi:hypothetical protein
MEKKKQFVIAWASDLDKLEAQVNHYLDQGYELKGGLLATKNEFDDNPVTAQVLVPKRTHKKKD